MLGFGLATTAGPSPSGDSLGDAGVADDLAPADFAHASPAGLDVPALDNSAATREPAGRATSGPEPDATVSKTVTARKGDTLMKVLTRTGADRRQAHDAIAALSRVFNPRKLKAGQKVTLTFRPPESGEGRAKLVGVAIAASAERDVVARRRDDGSFAPREVTRDLRRRLVRGNGDIDDSLYLAARRAGLPPGVLMEVIRIFSWDVDFQRDIQPGDRFDVVFARYLDGDGRTVREGEVVRASLTLSGTRLEVSRYEPAEDGVVDYFDRGGQSVRKALLRTPLDGARLTSGYGKRKHPILGYTRVHRGVDFGAPRGTPIYAAGDGVIESAGWNGNYGRYIRLRHNRELKSAYGHLRRIAKGIRRGKRVRQGQVIAYLGSTGLSTGPHLHYEVMVKGRRLNPMRVKLPSGRRLKGAELARFQDWLAELEPRIAQAQALSARVAENTACASAGAGTKASPC